jgi:hypothetical protein
MVALGLRMARSDAQLLKDLGDQLRAGQAGVVAIALRHLAESMRLGQPVYIAPPGCLIHVGFVDGSASPPPITADDLSVSAGQLIFWQGGAKSGRRVAAFRLEDVAGLAIVGPWQGADPFSLRPGLSVQMVPHAGLPLTVLGQGLNGLSQPPVGFPAR